MPFVEIARTPTFTEGPVFDRDGTLYFTSNEGLHKVSPDGRKSDWVLNKDAGFNGQKILPDGTHLVCASKKGAVWRMNAAGERTGDAAIECEGRPLRAPNDITLDDASGFYFTDPGGSRAAPIGTVHFTSRRGVTTQAAGGLRVPNGLVLSADRKFLFVAETVPNRVLRFPVIAPGRLGVMAVVAELPGRDGHEAAPDGLALGPANTLLVAHLGTESLFQLNYSGQIVRQFKTGLYDTSNLAVIKSNVYVTGSIGHRTNSAGRVHLVGV
ncbi:MAG: SMP-30/gluconolactonase/LRE family protein [Acidobacteria bacterium]|nr:SMP-30/gluconolactonase/LRE family protein [Acidobacteriota bacterium]